MAPHALPTTESLLRAAPSGPLDALGNVAVWFGVLGALFAALLGSRVIATLIEQHFARRTALHELRGSSGQATLRALSRLQVDYVTIGARSGSLSRKDGRVIAVHSARVETLAARTGRAEIVALTRTFIELGERFASGDPSVNAVTQRQSFSAVVDELTAFLR